MKLSRFFLVLVFGVLSLWLFALQQAPAQAAPSLAGPATVKVSVSSQAGTIITDGAGKTLYLLTADELNKSNCADRCAGDWPPLLTEGAPVGGPGAVARRLSTITRGDGATQVTYNGWPLYYLSIDERPGDVRGQGVGAFGGFWFVVSPSGGPRQTQAIVSVSQHATLGPILSDASGRTLYLATGDTPNKTNCIPDDRWPSLLTIAAPAAGAGVRSDLLGTIKRDEGSTQVTYNGWPLYYFNRDVTAGVVNGQTIADTCGAWYVLSVAGVAIQTPVTATPTAMPRTGTGGLLGSQDSTPYTLALAFLLGVSTISSLYFVARRSRP